MKLKFTLRDLFWLALVVAVAFAGWRRNRIMAVDNGKLRSAVYSAGYAILGSYEEGYRLIRLP